MTQSILPKSVALLLALLALPLLGSAQPSTANHRIKGRVFDAQAEQWMPAAGVRLLNPKDSTLVKGVLTDEDGAFRLEGLQKRTYLVSVSFVGYDEYFRQVTVGDKKELDLGIIRLSPSDVLLKGVEVVAQANPMTVKTDTVQFNTSAFTTRPNASIEELLRKIPGMEVDDDGNISYNGESIERIELDGRDFFSNDPRMATRNLPANMLSNVQVVDKKSEQARMTGMDDGERTKVLNLKVKEDRKKGLVVNAEGGYGTKERYTLNSNINYFQNNQRMTLLANLNNTDGIRRGRGDAGRRQVGLNYDNKFSEQLSLTAEARYDGSDNHTFGERKTENTLGSKRGNLEQQTYSDRGKWQTAQTFARLEWNPSDKTMLLLLPNLSWRHSSSLNENNFSTQNDQHELINRGTSLQESGSSTLDGDLRMHFRHTFNDAGRNLYVRLGANYQKEDGDGSKQSTTDFKLQDRTETLDQKSYSDGENISSNLSLSYLEPFSKEWALQLNYRLNTQNRRSKQLAYNRDDSGNYSLLDEDYSRGSTNINRTHRLGAQLRYSFWHRSNIYLGFDASPTYTHTTTDNGRVTTFDKERRVWNYSPSLTVDIRPADSLQVMLRYNGRTRHPSMTQLSDVPIINSPLSVTVGNPDLLPAYSHNLRMRMAFNRREARQSFELFGSAGITNNDITRRSSIDRETGRRQNTYENINGTANIWMGLSISTPIGGKKSHWTSFTFANMGMNRSKAFVNDQLNQSTRLMPRLSQRITWSGESLQASLSGDVSMQDVRNSIAEQLNRRTLDYSISNDLTWQLPYDLSLTSRLSYNDAAGYKDDIKRRLVLWDLSLAWSFLEGKNATVQLSGYDILGQRNTFRRSISADSITDQTVNGITTYAMLTFSYRFNTFGGGKMPTGEGGYRGRGFGGHRMGRPPMRI